MFRRTTDSDKDNGLFNEGGNEGRPFEETASGTSPSSSASPSTTSSSTANAAAPNAGATSATTPPHTPATSSTAQQTASASPISRPISEPRSTAVPTANSFRSNSVPMTPDRNRMPEAKPNPGMAAGINVDKANKTGRRVLTVGNDILLKGEIATCDRLVIEGKVDATLNDVHTVEIAETGSFKGSANIEDAEISGLFEGDLVVRNRLVIYATGKVRGKISYGEIEIERGGELTGEIKTTSPVTATSARPIRSGIKEDNKVAA